MGGRKRLGVLLVLFGILGLGLVVFKIGSLGRWLLGFGAQRHYVVLLQNNMELRPTGGFLGSFAEIWLEKGKLKNFVIQDIYVPDGQIKGYVKEPEPIKEYLFSGETPGWRLRDSNWSLDFFQAANEMKWFFEEGNIKEIDGIIGINLSLATEILKVGGPILLSDYGIEINAANFYQEAQYAAEHNFFPGSTQKGDFLRAVGRALWNKVTSEGWKKSGQMLLILLKQLNQGEITVAVFEPKVQEWVENLGWAGRIVIFEGADYWYINEANLGINKTNCCVERKIVDRVERQEAFISHILEIQYVNHNPPVPKPPDYWGGGYKNYLRVVTPKGSQLKSIKINEYWLDSDKITIETGEQYTVFGFLVLTEGGESSRVNLSYKVPNINFKRPYRIYLTKQPGMSETPIELIFKSKQGLVTLRESLQGSRTLTLPMVY